MARAIPAPASDPAFVTDATVEVRDLSVWFGPKVALSELSCSFGPGVTGLLGPNGAGKTTLMRAMTGLLGPNTGEIRVLGADPKSRSRGAAIARSRARGRSGASRPHGSPARPLRRRPARRRRRERGRSGHRDGRSDRRRRIAGSVASARACGSAPRSPPPSSTNPQVLVLDEPLNGADPVQRAASHRALPCARRGRPHGDRQLTRLARGRAARRAPDRVGAGKARRGRRSSSDPRRDGGSTSAGARPHSRAARFSPLRCSSSTS